ncbi:hypothetical protein Q5424_07470 [Conexibacter sp. JD483]|uniref:hypothetical protein n=1 Tax=unclassified Conexibacter TaxID=2627773 RepID=UPI00271E8FF1|nr:MULTISPECIES: hypothetical protein [unclassified Conexibacter]MDO8187115.1 hypothetical protein [Conexibacter sp. CPCC 205706]MDO8200291.1 hypothetical protein [Conexibacter sp. CPCC 205762]MDR9368913.1 hypothetical protein [Conexibacter sp. JD483]
MRRPLIALLALAALAAGAAPSEAARPRAVRNGVITVGFGAGGIEVGMKRAEVVSLLGRPFYENRNGYMQYMPDDGRGIFDVYRAGGGKGTRVRMISVVSSGRHFTLDEGIPIFEPGGLRAVKRSYGSRLRLVRTSDGELIYRIVTRAYGHVIDTDFTVTRPNLGARVMQVFVVKIS